MGSVASAKAKKENLSADIHKGKATTMKALVYHGPGKKAWEDKPKPTLQESTDGRY